MRKVIEFDNEKGKTLCEMTNEQRASVFNAIFDDDYYVEYVDRDGSWVLKEPIYIIALSLSMAYRVRKKLSGANTARGRR